MMTKEQIIAQLLEHRSELEAVGVEHLSLFGSVARDEATSESDIDVLVRFKESIIHSGFGYFGALTRLKERLEAITGRSIDILSEPIRKERLAREIERDRYIAF